MVGLIVALNAELTGHYPEEGATHFGHALRRVDGVAVERVHGEGDLRVPMASTDPAVVPSRPEFDVHVTENVLVPMRDDVRLATDVYRPACDGRLLGDARPVLLHRTPYNKTETEATMGQCRWFAARGYVVVN